MYLINLLLTLSDKPKTIFLEENVIKENNFDFTKIFPRHLNCYCKIPDSERKDCPRGQGKLDRKECNKNGCCYQQSQHKNVPDCYERKGD